MSKDTVLAIVQQILSDADGDVVNSISDTVESLQCADVLKDVFDQIVVGYDLHLHETLVKLTATSSTTPTVMSRPEGFYDIQWIKYDVKTTSSGDQAYQEATYMAPKDFIEMTSARTLSDSINEAMTLPDSGHIVVIRNDQAPRYFTLLDGYDDVVMDSYDSNLETNLQSSKSLAFGTSIPTLPLADATSPNLPQNLMVLLRREARAMYFDLYKDGVTREVDRTRRRAQTRAMRDRRIIRNTDNQTGPDYGRH